MVGLIDWKLAGNFVSNDLREKIKTFRRAWFFFLSSGLLVGGESRFVGLFLCLSLWANYASTAPGSVEAADDEDDFAFGAMCGEVDVSVGGVEVMVRFEGFGEFAGDGQRGLRADCGEDF